MTRLVGAALAEQHDEWTEGRRNFALDVLASLLDRAAGRREPASIPGPFRPYGGHAGPRAHLALIADPPGEVPMSIGEQVKTPRRQRGWSQADLADRVAGDPGQISRDKNGGITPSVEAVIRLAELLDVSTDYLLVEGAPHRPFRQADDALGARLADLDQLSDDDRNAVLHILDGLLANTRIRAALNSAAS